MDTMLAQTTQQEKYAEIKIHIDEKGLEKLAQLGLAVDHGIGKKGVFFIGDFSESELKQIEQAGFTYEILQADLANYYLERNTNTEEQRKVVNNTCTTTAPYPIPKEFNYGSMGGYLTYDELLAELDSMNSQFPNLITRRAAIDTFKTDEDRPIYWLKISDNPTISEGEPQILYTALHHAREPMSMTQMLYYMHYLLENYGVDEEITHLVDHTEMYFIPCVNPDGYAYNGQRNPDGGGMWRKNKRDNDGDGIFNTTTDGVDLNRNYGQEWAHDDTGSSPNFGAATYRGPAAFSEPETQAVKHFCEAHQIQITLNYHSFSNLLIYPWAYQPSHYTPDSAIYEQYADLLTQENHYSTGSSNETLNYLMNGCSDDWMYGEQKTKNKILAFIPEVGNSNDGFWPQKTRIIPLCQENMWQNLTAAQLIQQYATVQTYGDKYITDKNGSLQFSLLELGAIQGAGFAVSIQPINDAIVDAGNDVYIPSPGILNTITSTLFFQLKEGINIGDSIHFSIDVTNDSGAVSSKEILKYYGQPNQCYESDLATTSNWVFEGENGNWGLTEQTFISAPNCLADSPNGYYESNTDSRATLQDTIDLTNCTYATLEFWAKWDIESGYDYVQIEAEDLSTGGVTVLCGKYTHIGTPSQNTEHPLYDGQQTEWVQEEINLDAFIDKKIKLMPILNMESWYQYTTF